MAAKKKPKQQPELETIPETNAAPQPAPAVVAEAAPKEVRRNEFGYPLGINRKDRAIGLVQMQERVDLCAKWLNENPGAPEEQRKRCLTHYKASMGWIRTKGGKPNDPLNLAKAKATTAEA